MGQGGGKTIFRNHTEGMKVLKGGLPVGKISLLRQGRTIKDLCRRNMEIFLPSGLKGTEEGV